MWITELSRRRSWRRLEKHGQQGHGTRLARPFVDRFCSRSHSRPSVGARFRPNLQSFHGRVVLHRKPRCRPRKTASKPGQRYLGLVFCVLYR